MVKIRMRINMETAGKNVQTLKKDIRDLQEEIRRLNIDFTANAQWNRAKKKLEDVEHGIIEKRMPIIARMELKISELRNEIRLRTNPKFHASEESRRYLLNWKSGVRFGRPLEVIWEDTDKRFVIIKAWTGKTSGNRSQQETIPVQFWLVDTDILNGKCLHMHYIKSWVGKGWIKSRMAEAQTIIKNIKEKQLA
jgi:hypothetical protein